MRNVLILLLALFLFAPSTAEAAFPSIRSAQASEDIGNASSHSILLPATVESGDLLKCGGVFDGGATTYTWDNSTAGVWTELNTELNEVLTFIQYKIADGTEDAVTLTVTTGDGQEMAVYCVAIQNWHGSTAPEQASSVVDTAAPDPPSLNPTNWDSEDTLWFAWAFWDGEDIILDSVATNNGYPSGYTQVYTNSTGGAGGVGMAVATLTNAAASEDPGAFAITISDGTVANTSAVRPAAAGGGVANATYRRHRQ